MASFAQDVLDRFRRIGHNARTISSLVDQLATPLGVIPFVGAGMSADTGLPTWSSFLLAEAGTGALSERIRRMVDAGDYERAAQALHDARSGTAFQEAVEFTFGPRALLDRQPKGAVRCLPQPIV
jgi:hypothetical protein